MIISNNLVEKLHDGEVLQRLLKEKIFVTDASQFSAWSACFIKGFYEHGLKRVSTHDQAALLFGGAIHKGMAVHLRGGTIEEAMSAVRVEATLRRLDDCMDPKRTTEKATQMMESYIHDVTIQPSKKLIAIELNGQKIIEQAFCLPLGVVKTLIGEVQIMWMGIVDLIAYLEREMWVTDHKTTSVMGEKFVDDKVRSDQVPGYLWAAQILTEHLPTNLAGCLINALAHRATGYEFKQFKIPLSQMKIEEWKQETLKACAMLIDRLVNTASGDNLLVPTRPSCVTKYGKCRYFDLCDNPQLVRERLLYDEAYYKHNDWDPTKGE